jgi:hypothetical protein
MQQILDQLQIALTAFDCDRSLNLLSEAVAEYRRMPEMRDHVWARQASSKNDVRKVSDLAAKRRLSELSPR